MASLLSPTAAEKPVASRDAPAPGQGDGEEILLAGEPEDPLLKDCATYLVDNNRRPLIILSNSGERCSGLERVAGFAAEDGSMAGLCPPIEGRRFGGIVVFLSRGHPHLETITDRLAGARVDQICVVSNYRAHFGDRKVVATEHEAVRRLQGLCRRLVLFRPAPVLSPHSRATTLLRTLWFCYPLVPRGLVGCCVDGHELFSAIGQEFDRPSAGRHRVYTLLGANRPWRTRLKEHQQQSLWQTCLSLLARGLGLLGIGLLAALVLRWGARLRPRLRRWSFDTLYPESTRELLALYNRYNFRHVKIAGYNNGVVHFGWKYPGKTVISTICCNKVARVHGDRAVFDGGVILRQSIEVLGKAGKEFYVLPNYSYVSVGTAFFVPVHGSASEYCTLGETIEKVLWYSPMEDRFTAAARDTPAFRDRIYDMASDVLLLRARFRVKDKALYYRVQTRLESPTAGEILAAFHDRAACNVEVRKARAGRTAVELYRYYLRPPDDSTALLFPKDSLGKLWDRLEANPILSVLFHGLVRRYGYHVELFLTPEEFAVFWETHRSLPIAKIQLRYIKQDGFLHSPFRQHDCISVDLFMLRKHRQAFENYVKETFRAVQFNPGKHSV
jgi:hypothetical protein